MQPTENRVPIYPGKSGKVQVADAVFASVKEWEKDPSFEVIKVSDLMVRVRYKRHDQSAPRYFEIRVSEPI